MSEIDSHHGSQLELFGEHMENYNVEASAIHRKLQSKIEALHILRKELEQFRTERDQFKLMAETLQLRYSAVRRNTDYNNCGFGGKSSVASMLHDTRERNIKLTTELEAMKQKLSELQGDIEVLRVRGSVGMSKEVQPSVSSSLNREEDQWKQEKADFICHLENLKKKNAQLAFDLKAILDEKEEAVTERDAYKCKAHRLNHELLLALKANESHPRLLDVDSIVLENKYLQERLKNSEAELEFTTQSMNKYKAMLDAKRKKVKKLLDNGVDLPTKTETIADLKSLCLALLDNLNDKNLALNHQKKTNKILASKIAELEQRIQIVSGCESGSSDVICFSPSQILLNGYCPSSVDTEPKSPNVTEDSGTMSSEPDDSQKTSRVSEEDGMSSSLSTESGRSILSSEYDVAGSGSGIGNGAQCSLLTSDIMTSLYPFKDVDTKKATSITSSIAKERLDDLKDLPPELAAMVQKALHDLDVQEFEESLIEDAAH
ncbi:coiled-coil domain-containing protein 149 isoform X2 [Eupeodes corollae]|uniref:coiled-coil domain-containing protein 149 isoform X2 n=1 Tax=Eupeodes corollae TaxID=290404 RepID=UPI00248FC58C|nr:coiled-coil domain-containing protein 149 isoform X2 [Eupeodes corollae]